MENVSPSNISIYLGNNAGNMLEKEIENAKTSIIVTSPYIAYNKIDHLIEKSHQGVKVHICLAEREPLHADYTIQNILKKIIVEKIAPSSEQMSSHKHDSFNIDNKSDTYKNKKKFNRLFLFRIFLLILIPIVTYIYYLYYDYNHNISVEKISDITLADVKRINNLSKISNPLKIAGNQRVADQINDIAKKNKIPIKVLQNKEKLIVQVKNKTVATLENKGLNIKWDSNIRYLCFYFIITFILYFSSKAIQNFLYKDAKKNPIITNFNKYKHCYRYINSNIKVSYFLKKENEEYDNNTNKVDFLHAKFYVIDNKVVYLGSLNYTNNGFNNSIETTVRIEDENIAEHFTKASNSLWEHVIYHNIFKDTTYTKKSGKTVYRKSLAKIVYGRE